MSGRKMLVIGAQPGSLGEAIALQADFFISGIQVRTTGVSGYEDETWPENPDNIQSGYFSSGPFTDVVCTIGVNVESVVGTSTFGSSIETSLSINALAPLLAAEAWLESIRRVAESRPLEMFQFVAISSNSAQIPRSMSVGYCASKAALTMGMRCLARQVADIRNVSLFVYEPGWIEDTPMSEAVMERIGSLPAHRIPGQRKGIRKSELVNMICDDLYLASPLLNGTVRRVDGGEI